MFTGKKSLALISLLVVIAVIYSQRATLVVKLIERVAEQRMGLDATASLPDGLSVVLCGAGGPLPDPKRSGPCVAVIAGKTLVVVDAGTGGSRNLAAMQIPQGNIDALFLTHFHSDHIDGLGELAMMRWVNAANTTPLPVIGPSGLQAVIDGFNQAYGSDAVYRNAHHTDMVAPLSGRGMSAVEFVPPQNRERKTVFEKDGLVVTMFSVDHEPVSPAVGYRFDYKGRSLVVSGDTAKSENLQNMAEGVDLLVHEALSRKLVGVMNAAAKANNNEIIQKITFDIIDYHASPVEAAEIAKAAKVGHLLYYHVVPALIVPGMEAVYLEGVSEVYDGPTTVGVDGTVISLPAGSKDIETESWL